MRNGGPASRWGCRVQSEAEEARPCEKASASLTPPTLGRTGAVSCLPHTAQEWQGEAKGVEVAASSKPIPARGPSPSKHGPKPALPGPPAWGTPDLMFVLGFGLVRTAHQHPLKDWHQRQYGLLHRVARCSSVCLPPHTARRVSPSSGLPGSRYREGPKPTPRL